MGADERMIDEMKYGKERKKSIHTPNIEVTIYFLIRFSSEI